MKCTRCGNEIEDGEDVLTIKKKTEDGLETVTEDVCLCILYEYEDLFFELFEDVISDHVRDNMEDYAPPRYP